MTPSPASRFGGFAAGHFVVTALCAPLIFLMPGLLALAATPLGALLLMAVCYLPAGWIVAALRGWRRPSPGEGLKAVLYPALFAWGWALGGWLLFICPLSSVGNVGFLMLLSTYFLACPSFVFMLAALNFSLGVPLDSLLASAPFLPLWYLCMFLAGLLPPLLFFLGSQLPHRVKEDLDEETDHNCCGNPSPCMPGDSVGGEPPQPGGDPAVRPLPPDGAGGDRGGLPEPGQSGGAV